MLLATSAINDYYSNTSAVYQFNSNTSLKATPIANYYNDMNTLDITNMTWSTQTQSQTALTYVGYTAPNGLIVTLDGNFIICGGSTHDSSDKIAYVFSDIDVLNTNSWVWPVPSVSGTSAPPFTYHSAALYQNYMIITFDN
ncbi:hypothetical protein F8M41_025195 [Gigaspora margarita]|uniref:Kelch repeat protein n=1 Tax=Gigaspora margarita TaxID=4874 RepID=A0A8H4B043_GIGMA|nr:hypothetical protein F8M41_025195 [Gigaspora margarita]